MKKFLAIFVAAVMVFAMAACGDGGTSTADEDSQVESEVSVEEEDGSEEETEGGEAAVYTSTVQGYGGEFTVEVTMTDDEIVSISIGEHSETDGIGGAAIEQLPVEIINSQSIAVDGVSGATITSNAILEAVADCIGQSGADISKFQTVAGSDSEGGEETLEADVVIVGAGGAGMSAAIEAASAGKSVILVEKAGMTGGNTTRSTGGMNAAETPEEQDNEFTESAGVEKTIEDAKEKYGTELADLIATVEEQYAAFNESGEGYFDSVELFMLDTLVGGGNVNDPALVEVLAQQSAGGIEWLKSIGADLTSVGSFGGASVKRIHRPVDAEGKTIAVGSYIVPILTQNCEDLGIEILYNTTATEIIMVDGAAAGIIASGDKEYTINAKAVVLATGGFGANEEMYTSYKPDLAGFVTTNAPGMMGDGIVMGEAVGAATVDMEQIQIHPTVEQETSALITEGLRGDGAILVNAEGQRFIDEVGTRDVVSAAEVAQTGGYAWLVVDQAMVDASSVIGGYITSGFTVDGESYEALAEAMGVDAEAFAATMETWNAAVAAQSDADFGRTSFANPLDTAPYYAIKVAPGVHHTMGGLKINTNTEVLDADGNAIPGLYAAGEVTGGVHGSNRLGGNAVADIIVFGRIAGQQAASIA